MLPSGTSGRRSLRLVAAAGALTVASMGAVVAPAAAIGGPSFMATDYPSFTVTDSATGQPFTTLAGVEGQRLDVRLVVDPETAWSEPPGWSFGNPSRLPGVTVTVTPGEGDTYLAEIQGTPETGYYDNRRVTFNNIVSPYRIQIAPRTPPPAISLDPGEFAVRNVTVPRKGEAFAEVPALALRTDDGRLVPFTYPQPDEGSITRVKDGSVTITRETTTLFIHPVYGAVYADVVVSGTRTTLRYEVTTRSMSWEGEPVVVGDLVLTTRPRATATAVGRASDTPEGDLRFLLEDTADLGPAVVATSSVPGATATVSSGVVSLTMPGASVTRSAELTVVDYAGCAEAGELLRALEGGDLLGGDYVATGTCSVPDPTSGPPTGGPPTGGPPTGGPPTGGLPTGGKPGGGGVDVTVSFPEAPGPQTGAVNQRGVFAFAGTQPMTLTYDRLAPGVRRLVLDGRTVTIIPVAGFTGTIDQEVIVTIGGEVRRYTLRYRVTGVHLAATGTGGPAAPLGLALAFVLAGAGLLVLRRDRSPVTPPA
jgi:hypothetical protein